MWLLQATLEFSPENSLPKPVQIAPFYWIIQPPGASLTSTTTVGRPPRRGFPGGALAGRDSPPLAADERLLLGLSNLSWGNLAIIALFLEIFILLYLYYLEIIVGHHISNFSFKTSILIDLPCFMFVFGNSQFQSLFPCVEPCDIILIFF